MKRSTSTIILSLAASAVLFSCNGPTGLNNGREDPSLAIGYEEASVSDIAKEVASLGEAIAVSSTLAKSAEPGVTLSGQSWAYASGWWTRSGKISATGEAGENLTFDGYDSVQFKNTAMSVVQYPIVEIATSAILRHNGHAYAQNRFGGYIDMDRTFSLSGVISRTTDTTFVLNGTLSQYFKAENANQTAWCDYTGEAQATDITYKKVNGVWSRPVSGTISMSSPYRNASITIVDGIATITVTDKVGVVKRTAQVIL